VLLLGRNQRNGQVEVDVKQAMVTSFSQTSIDGQDTSVFFALRSLYESGVYACRLVELGESFLKSKVAIQPVRIR